MDLPALTLALLALLLTPGPTNTLMALAGAERGLGGAARLIPAEIAAYLAVTLPLALAGPAVIEGLPLAKRLVTLAAALWVLALALRLWRLPQAAPDAAVVTAARVFATTLLNPKGLVIGLVLLPGPDLALRGGILVATIAAVALAWAGLGARLSRTAVTRAGPLPLALRRLAAAWLALLSLGLAATGMGA